MMLPTMRKVLYRVRVALGRRTPRRRQLWLAIAAAVALVYGLYHTRTCPPRSDTSVSSEYVGNRRELLEDTTVPKRRGEQKEEKEKVEKGEKEEIRESTEAAEDDDSWLVPSTLIQLDKNLPFVAPHADPAFDGRFVYVYELGTQYTDDVLRLKPKWFSEQYNVERNITNLLRLPLGKVRTYDPEKASLFFVPFFSARYTLYHYQDWLVNMDQAVKKTSQMWSEVLTRVRIKHPYFNRTNGRDHFGVLTMDHGRCSALTFVRPELYGDMFFIMYNGDRMVSSDFTDPQRNMQAIAYNQNATRDFRIPSIPCYVGGRDIVVPPYVTLPLVAPNASSRTTTIVFRFSPGQHHGVPIRHHGHEIRREIREHFMQAGEEGWSFEVKDEAQTTLDWQATIFCACPPGHSQWTSRMFKCLMSGAIPITFFRQHDNPFDDVLDYTQFSINIDPDDILSLKPTVDAAMSSPARLTSLRQAVAQVQDKFMWTNSWERGAERMLLHQLRRRAAAFRYRPFAEFQTSQTQDDMNDAIPVTVSQR